MFARNRSSKTIVFLRICRHGIVLKQLNSSQNSFVSRILLAKSRASSFNKPRRIDLNKTSISKNDIGLYLRRGSGNKMCFVGNAFIGNTDQVWQPADEIGMPDVLQSNTFHEKAIEGIFGAIIPAVDDGRRRHRRHAISRNGRVRLHRGSPSRGARFCSEPCRRRSCAKAKKLLPLLETRALPICYPLIDVPADRTRSSQPLKSQSCLLISIENEFGFKI